MQQLILMFHILFCLAIIALVLLQHGKGADMGAAFGAGASQTVFGSRGTTSFLFKITAIFAALFFATSLSLTYLATKQVKQNQFQLPSSITDSIPVQNSTQQQNEPIPLSTPVVPQGNGNTGNK